MQDHVLRFARPTVRHCVLWAVAGMICFGLLAIFLPPGRHVPWLPAPTPSVTWVAGMVLAGAVLTLMMVVVMGTQRVEIDGTTVRVANLSTFHRWRIFSVNEVTRLNLHGFQSGSIVLAMVVQLAPAPHRRWCRIDITSMRKTDTNRDIDSALFLAFFHAVVQAQPDMEIARFPDGYNGPMRRSPARS